MIKFHQHHQLNNSNPPTSWGSLPIMRISVYMNQLISQQKSNDSCKNSHRGGAYLIFKCQFQSTTVETTIIPSTLHVLWS